MAGKIIVLSLLAVNSLRDLRQQRIFLLPTLAVLSAGVFFASLGTGADMAEILAGAWPGLLLLAFSILTRGKIGFGDGLVLLACGIWTGPLPALEALLAALLLALPVPLIMRRDLHSALSMELPLVPFLTAGYVLQLAFR